MNILDELQWRGLMADCTDMAELAKRAAVQGLPAWVIYREGIEVSRATGENADLSVDRLLAEQSAAPQ